LYHFIPIAPNVAINTENTDDVKPIRTLLPKACYKSGELVNSSIYHFSEKPVHKKFFELLNDSVTSITIGK
jgi:hypothetical protein